MSYAYPQPAYLQQPATRTSAPIGVHFIAILYYLGGVFYLLAAAGAGVVLATGQLDRYSDRYNAQIPLSPDDRMAASIVVVAALAIIGLITIWFGRRLQIGRNWARVLLNFFLLVSVAGIGYGAWVAQDPTVLIALVQPVFYLLLLNTRAARSWFRRHTW